MKIGNLFKKYIKSFKKNLNTYINSYRKVQCLIISQKIIKLNMEICNSFKDLTNHLIKL